MHELMIDASKLTREEWSIVCARLDTEAYSYSSQSGDKKIFVQCPSVSQMADVIELIKEITDIN